ncbi:MAG: MerR family transcriptional regulator [Oscillospiraceae bacterium]|jgi:DNA-binding transcriptional MerR regulator|nr:MerR family transcriptional regulator [Oscillospiraceae bacterium]
MADEGFLSISDFADYSRTTRDALLYYDKIGLISPARRGENNYRLYSVTQVGAVNMVRILRELGMSLDDIRNLQKRRTPKTVSDMLASQIEKIDTKLNEWNRARKLLFTMRKVIQSASNIDENEIVVRFMPAESIVLGELNDYSRGRNDYDALTDFYHAVREKHPDLDMNYPVWGVFSKAQIRRRDYSWPERYYFYNPEGHDKRPAAMYAIGYARGGYGKSDDLFKRLLNYIRINNLVIYGDSYKEYPLNEVCVPNEDDYLIRVMIPVLPR